MHDAPRHAPAVQATACLTATLLYQEFAISYSGVCPININLHFFLDGCAFTFGGVWLITSGRTNDATPRHDDDELDNQIIISDEIVRDRHEQLLVLSPKESVPTSAPPPPSKAQQSPLVATLDTAQAKLPRPAQLATIQSQNNLKLDLGREPLPPPPVPVRGGEPEHLASPLEQEKPRYITVTLPLHYRYITVT